LPAQPTHTIQVITSCSITHHQPTHSSPIVVHVTETYCYVLQACLHSPRWPPSRMRCSTALILLVSQHLVPVARPASFTLLTYHSYWLLVCSHSFRWPTSRTRCSFAIILLAGLHLIRVAPLSSFAVLAYSYALLVCPYSPCWPTSRTGCSSALILHIVLLLRLVARLTSILLTYVRTCGRNAMLGISGLHLVRVARLSSFAMLAYSYALLVCPRSPYWRTAPTRFLFDLVLLTYIWTCGRNTVLGISGLHLLRVARLSSFAALAYSYTLLVCPRSPCWCTAPTHFSFYLVFADLHSDLWEKHRVRHQWPTSRTCC